MLVEETKLPSRTLFMQTLFLQQAPEQRASTVLSQAYKGPQFKHNDYTEDDSVGSLTDSEGATHAN